MILSATAVNLEAILPWRDMYRLEMGCQIIHDSIHGRPGWTREYALAVDGSRVGYGSVAVAGPWKGTPTIYEFYVAPHERAHVFELFRALLAVSDAVAIEVQSNDSLSTVMMHTFAQGITSEKIVFHDKLKTALAPAGARFRRAARAEARDIPRDQLPWFGVVELDGRVAAKGGVLFHYNPPFGDIYMEVDEPFRRRGLGSFLVQELKRLCYEGGKIPAARCSPDNIASWRSLQKAGFVPCGHMLTGTVAQGAAKTPSL